MFTNGTDETTTTDRVVTRADVGLAWKLLAAAAIGLLANGMLLMVLVKKRYRHVTANFYTINLLVGDLMLCTCAGPVRAVDALLPTAWGSTGCRMYALLRYLPVYGATTALCLIAVERLVAVVWPTKFKWWALADQVRTQIAAMWVLSFLLTLYPMIKVQATDNSCIVYEVPSLLWYVFITCVLIPTAFLALVYGSIVFVVWKRLINRRKKLVPVDLTSQSTLNNTSNDTMNSKVPTANKKPLQNEKLTTRLTWVAAGVTLLFLGCWLPSFIPAFISSYGAVTYSPNQWFEWTSMLLYLHATANPILYFIVDPKFKKEWLIILGVRSQGSP